MNRPNHIKPTVGRVLYYWPNRAHHESGDQPMAAQIAYVLPEIPEEVQLLNISYMDHSGFQHPRLRVPLIQEGMAAPDTSPFCTWIPFQLGQALQQQQAQNATGLPPVGSASYEKASDRYGHEGQGTANNHPG